MEEKSKTENNLDFYSVYSEELELKFDCVVGNSVSHYFPMHIHNSLCVGLITKGVRCITWADKITKIHLNEIFIINRNQPHAINQVEPHDYIVITVKGDSDGAIFENSIKSHLCTDLFLQLFYSLTKGFVSELPEKWNDLHDYLINTHKVAYSTLPTSTNEDFLRKSFEYIQTNYQQQISVNEIAAHACMSTYHFCRQFKRLTGISPHSYLKQYRLSQSYTRLQNNTPVFDTAIDSGFYDSSHFVKTFQSYMAVSPKEYQRSVTK